MRIATRFLLVAIVMYQGVGLNNLVVEHWSHAETSFKLFVAVDIINCILLSACIWLAYFAIRWMKWKRKRLNSPDHELCVWTLSSNVDTPTWVVYLPAISYSVYILTIFLRTVLIFVEDFNDIKEQKSELEFGEKMSIYLGLTAVVFFLFSLCHQNAHPNTQRKHLLGILAGAVTLDVVDIVEFMELLFDDVKTEPDSLLICVMVFSCLALFVPCVALFNLSKSNFGARQPDKRFHVLYLLLNLFLVNVPFLIIRLLVKLHHEEGIMSVMIIKNAILIAASCREFYHVHVSLLKTGSFMENLSGVEPLHPEDNSVNNNGGGANGEETRWGGANGLGTNGVDTNGGVALNSVKPIGDGNLDVEAGAK